MFLWKHAKFKGLISTLWHQNVYFWSIISLWIWAFSCKTYADTDLRSVVEDRIKVSLTPVFIEVKKHVSGFWRDFQYFSTLYRRCLVRFCSFWTFIRSLLPCGMKQKKLEKQVTTYFDHNFFKSKRIDFRFCTLAKLEKLNNFPTDRPEVDVTKKSTFRCTPLKRGGT